MSRFYNLDQAPFNSRELSKAIVAAITGQYNGAYFDAQDMSTMFQDAAGKDVAAAYSTISPVVFSKNPYETAETSV